MIGMLITPIKVQLGPIANGLVIVETFLPSPKLQFAGLDDVMKRYQAKAPELKTDPLGYAFVPIGYAAGQMLAQAVDRDQEPRPRQARRLHAQGDSSRPWSATSRSPRTANGPRRASSPRRSRTSQPNNLDQFRDGSKTAGPVAARVQDRRHHLSLRRRAEEVAID